MMVSNPILITGVPRSGATMIASILKVCGAFSGDVSKMNVNTHIGDLTSRYFEFNGYDENYPLPITKEMALINNWKERVEISLQKKDGYESGKWFYKDSRAGLIWPVWEHAYPHAKWIIVRRRTGDIVESCLKTAYMTAFKDKTNQELVGVDNEKDGWLWWVHEYQKRFVEMMEAGLNCKVIWPDRMVSGDYGQIYEMLEWLGLEWNSQVVTLMEPLLANSRKKEKCK